LAAVRWASPVSEIAARLGVTRKTIPVSRHDDRQCGLARHFADGRERTGRIDIPSGPESTLRV
jgi:hypothetical protein